MKLYLDDERKTPIGWARAYTAKETIELLKTENVTELSLDHDLEPEHYGITEDNQFTYGANLTGTGYDVMLWLEQNPDKLPPVVKFHTMNPVGRARMQACLDSILKTKGDK